MYIEVSFCSVKVFLNCSFSYLIEDLFYLKIYPRKNKRALALATKPLHHKAVNLKFSITSCLSMLSRKIMTINKFYSSLLLELKPNGINYHPRHKWYRVKMRQNNVETALLLKRLPETICVVLSHQVWIRQQFFSCHCTTVNWVDTTQVSVPIWYRRE